MDQSKATLISLLEELNPIIEGNSIFIDQLEIVITGSGYASITLHRALDQTFFERLFVQWDYYIEGSEASITVKPGENIYFYGNDGTHDVAFGPQFDRDLLNTVFLYVDRNFPGQYPRIRQWLGLSPLQ